MIEIYFAGIPHLKRQYQMLNNEIKVKECDATDDAIMT